MENLNEMGLVEIDQNDVAIVNGGYLLTEDLLNALNWAYTELKKGIDDGYNNK